jgi:UDP-N-acetylmuramyl pentapeptide synthase
MPTSSMAVAIENFLQLESTSKIIGDMFELGEE